MFGRSLAIQASIKSWSKSLSGESGSLLGQARSYAEPSQDRSYQTGASNTVKRSLVQDLKYRFRIKAAQKHELYDPSLGVTRLSRVTVQDVRNIWMYRLMSEVGLPSYKVTIPRGIVLDMEEVIKEKMPLDQDGCIQFEDFLPHLVYLVRVEVTSDDEEEMVSELMQFYSGNLKNMPSVAREELRERAVQVISQVRDKQ